MSTPMFPKQPYVFPFDMKRETLNGHTRDLSPGMSLRDYFAAMAMQALIARQGHDPLACAVHAYAHADAMLAEAAKQRI